MNYLLDTCLLSELVKTDASANVLNWLKSKQAQNLYISSITWGELHRGVVKMPDSKRRNELSEWLSALNEQFGERNLSFSSATAEHWALLTSSLEAQGKTMSLMDSLICATAQEHKMTLVTRNTKDFIHAPVLLLNPWDFS